MTNDRAHRNDTAARLEAALRTHLATTAGAPPIAIEALIEALRDGGADMAFDLIASLAPRRLDPHAMHQWLMGGPALTPVKRIDPESSRARKAGGERHMALAKVAEAKRGIDACKARLAEAEAKLALCESDLEEADDRNRHQAIHRLLGEVVMQGAVATRMGSMYTLARAISPYLQVDDAYEASLSLQQAEDLARRRELRRPECMEILDLLDRYAGDPRLEINLQRQILTVLREHHRRFQTEIEQRRAAGIKSTDRMKRRALRRNLDDMKTSVHPAAPLVDVREVFEAFEDAYQEQAAASSGQPGDASGHGMTDD